MFVRTLNCPFCGEVAKLDPERSEHCQSCERRIDLEAVGRPVPPPLLSKRAKRVVWGVAAFAVVLFAAYLFYDHKTSCEPGEYREHEFAKSSHYACVDGRWQEQLIVDTGARIDGPITF